MRTSVLLLSLCFLSFSLYSQILPKEGSNLNYRLIGFSFPANEKTSTYKIEIALGNYNTEDSFKKNIVKTISCKTNKIVGEVPAFGSQYTWRFVTKNIAITKSALYHFSTQTSVYVDTNIMRFRVMHNAERFKDAYVFLDATRALYDMDGHPVWFLPEKSGFEDGNILLRDLKISAFGTINFVIDGHEAYDIDYNGNVLWKGPDNGIISGDSSEHYHHEFTRLTNGHYMVLGNEYSQVIIVYSLSGDSSLQLLPMNMPLPDGAKKILDSKPFGTIIEYDEKGKVVWSWKSSSYLNGSDILYHIAPDGSHDLGTNVNSFFFDEKEKAVYLSFKVINRVVKVKYPEGTIMNVCGESFKPQIGEQMKDLFCGQHSCKISRKGYLYLFNNNDCNWPATPSIVMMQQPVSEKDSIKKVWEYKCPTEQTNEEIQAHHQITTAGGNVIELPDYSIFASVCNPYGKVSPYSKVFIVSHDKKILWSATPEKWNAEGKKWQPLPLYRASIITSRKDMEHLVWGEEIKDLKE